jgi:sugar phosphate isomerase/epimerase
MSKAELQSIRQALKNTGLTALMSMTGQLDRNGRSGMFQRIEYLAELGIPELLTIGPRGDYVQDPGPETFQYLPGELVKFAEDLSACADFAQEHGVHISLKPHGGPTGTGAGLKQLADALDGRIGVYFDPGNILFYVGTNPEDELSHITGNLSGLCIKDHRGELGGLDFPTPGTTGEVNWNSIFGALHNAGSTGPALIELVGGLERAKTPDETQKELAAAKEYLQPFVDSLLK